MSSMSLEEQVAGGAKKVGGVLLGVGGEISRKGEKLEEIAKEKRARLIQRLQDRDAIDCLRKLPLVSGSEFLFAKAFDVQVKGWNPQSGWTAYSLRDFEPVAGEARWDEPTWFGGRKELRLTLGDKTTSGDLKKFMDELKDELKGDFVVLDGAQPSRISLNKDAVGRKYVDSQAWVVDRGAGKYSEVRLEYNENTRKPVRLEFFPDAYPLGADRSLLGKVLRAKK